MQPDIDLTNVLRIAVTGHRDLADGQESSLGQSVRDAFASLVEICQPARVELITAMADGADQLVAETALELGCRVHVVLPKPLDLYRDELSKAGRRLLDELTTQPGVRFSTIEGGSTESATVDQGALPYHHLGLYLARSAHVLIALWNGEPERKSGGTLDVLARFLDRDFDLEARTDLPHPIDESEHLQGSSGPTAIWIKVSRSDDVVADSTPTKFLTGSGLPGIWRGSPQIPAPLASMLDDLSLSTRAEAKSSTSNVGYPLLEQIPDDVDPGRLTALSEIHDAYMSADRMALFHQTRSDWSFIGASLIAAAMGFAFLWFAKIDSNLLWLYGYLALFLVGYALFRTARSQHWLRHHLSHRVLAETLRVRFFTSILGISEQVDIRKILTLTGVSSFPGFGWAAEADRVGVPTTVDLPPDVESKNDLVRSKWVDDQAGYFERKIKQLDARHERLELIQRVLYVLSFVTAAVIIIYGSELKKIYAPGHVSAKTILIFLMGLLPLWLTLWELHQGRMATRELLWQFRNQATIFRGASTQLHHVDNNTTREKIYVELAERSLFETYLWTIHRFHREFTPPAGG